MSMAQVARHYKRNKQRITYARVGVAIIHGHVMISKSLPWPPGGLEI
jgi:hypothetical protein